MNRPARNGAGASSEPGTSPPGDASGPAPGRFEQVTLGLLAPLSGAERLLRTPGLWPYAIVPGLLGLGWGAIVALAFLTDRPTAAWWSSALAAVWQGTLFLAVAMIQVGIALAAPILDRLSERVELELGAVQADHPFWRNVLSPAAWLRILRGFVEAFKLLAVKLALLAVGLLLDALIGFGIGYVFAGLVTGLDFLDYPLERRELSARDKLAWARGRGPAVLAFGAAVAFFLAVPGLGGLALVPCVVGGTELALRLGDVAPDRSSRTRKVG